VEDRTGDGVELGHGFTEDRAESPRPSGVG
jgi:hypothetical protein